MKIMVTGHRPNQLGGYEKTNSTRKWIKAELWNLLARIAFRYKGREALTLISGGAQGVDQDFIEVGLLLKIPIHVYIPGIWQADNWPLESQEYYYTLLRLVEANKLAEGKIINCDSNGYGYAAWKLLDRNSRMIEDADVCIAVWNGSGKGGTYDAVKKIRESEKPWYRIDPHLKKSEWQVEINDNKLDVGLLDP